MVKGQGKDGGAKRKGKDKGAKGKGGKDVSKTAPATAQCLVRQVRPLREGVPSQAKRQGEDIREGAGKAKGKGEKGVSAVEKEKPPAATVECLEHVEDP